jgi:hypothetical protein
LQGDLLKRRMMFYCCCVSNWAGKGLQNTQGWMVKSVISACKSLEEEIILLHSQEMLFLEALDLVVIVIINIV